MGVDPDRRIHIRPDILEADGPMLRHGLQNMHSAAITVPKNIALQPNVEYLAERSARFKAA